jgi:integrase
MVCLEGDNTPVCGCDLKALKWEDIQENNLTTRIIQKKTNRLNTGAAARIAT